MTRGALLIAALLLGLSAPLPRANAAPVLVAALAGTSIWAALASTLFSIVSSVLIGVVSQALFGKAKPNTRPAPQSVTTTIRSSDEPRRLLYGQRNMGGIVVFAGTARTGQETEGGQSTTTVKDLHLVLALCDGPVSEIQDVYFNDTTSDDPRFEGLPGVDSFTISKHLGTASQAADPGLIAAMPSQWSSAHRLRGVAYLYVKLIWNQSPVVWVTGIPNITASVRGLAVYDPRNGLTRYSRNPALVLRDYLTRSAALGGFGADDDELDDDYVSAAANACDEVVDIDTEAGVVVHGVTPAGDSITLVNNPRGYGLGDRIEIASTGTLPSPLVAATGYWLTPISGQDPNKVAVFKLSTSYANALAESYINITTAGSGTIAIIRTGQVRYTCDAVIGLDQAPVDIIEAILSSMAGQMAYTQGKFRMFAGAARVALPDGIGVGDLRGPMTVQTRTPRRELFNACRGTIPDATRYYQETSFPPVRNSTYIAQDGGQEIYRDLDLPCTTSPLRAQRIAKVILERSRQGITVKAPLNWGALRFAVGDVVPVSDAALGWSDKEFEILDWTLAEGGGVDLVLQEYSAAVYDWADGEATRIDPAPDTELPDWSDVQAPGLALSDDVVPQGGGVVNRLLLDITLPSDEFVSRFDVEYRAQGASAWIPVSGNVQQILGVEDLVTYEVRVRGVNTLGAVSEWTTAAHTVIGQSGEPADVEEFSVNILDGTAHLSWRPVADADLSHYRIRWSPLLTGANWTDAVDLVPRVGRPATSVHIPALVGSYLIKAVDFKGIESESAAIIASNVASLTGLNVVETIDEDPDFAGVHDNTTVLFGRLRLVAGGLVSDWDLVSEVPLISYGETGGPGIVSMGTYTFAQGIDLGAAYTSRVTATLQVQGANVLDLVSGWPLVSALQSISNVESSEHSTQLQLRTTDDDPAGSPVDWSEWRDFIVGDYTCRAMQFRALLGSSRNDVTPLVETLSVTVDMPDVVQSGHDLTALAAGSAVLFPTGFKAAPAVAITGQNLATGDYWALTSVTPTGFTIRFFNAAGSGVQRTYDYLAKSYGRAA